MLALEVEFLLGRYTATHYRNREQAEWPPHPSRLFSALVAACHESRLGESARAALLWLESQDSPQVHAQTTPSFQDTVTTFVPINDPSEDILPGRAEKQPRNFPSVVPDPPNVWFVWPQAQPDGALTAALTAILANVTYLGSSRSPVRIRLGGQPPDGPKWIPDTRGTIDLRVAGKGRLLVLEDHYRHRLRPPVGPFRRYRLASEEQQPTHQRSPFGEMIVFRFVKAPVAMEIETCLRLTILFRAAVLQRAGSDAQELLSGHEENRHPLQRIHAAYVALPFVSATQEHADGHLLGVAMVLPRSLAPAERRSVYRALAGLRQLQLHNLGAIELQRLRPGEAVPYNLDPKTWSAGSRRWASVTPMLLDRFPRRDGHDVEAIIAQSCRNLGLQVQVEVEARPFSRLFGVPPCQQFDVQRGNRKPRSSKLRENQRRHFPTLLPPPRVAGAPRVCTHITLTFAEKVEGPLLLGAGRYFGLGLLRPLPEGEDQP